jgi:hypothetical protein
MGVVIQGRGVSSLGYLGTERQSLTQRSVGARCVELANQNTGRSGTNQSNCSILERDVTENANALTKTGITGHGEPFQTEQEHLTPKGTTVEKWTGA